MLFMYVLVGWQVVGLGVSSFECGCCMAIQLVVVKEANGCDLVVWLLVHC